MANVQFGGGVVDMRGSIGGTTFARGPYGAYARARTTPINPNSTLQQIVREKMSQAASAYAGITQAQKDAWALYAANTPTQNKLGQEIFLSGFNWYCACNAARLRDASLAQVAAGPTTFGRPDTPTAIAMSCTASSSTTSLAFAVGDSWVDEDDAALFVFLSQPRSIGRTFVGPPYRLATTVLGDNGTPPTSPAAGVNPWGVVETTMRQDVYAFTVRVDGRISTKVESAAVIA